MWVNVFIDRCLSVKCAEVLRGCISFTCLLVSNYGTGSYPCPPHGWQRPIRFSASQKPLKGPCFFMASIAYSEQVGVYLHDGGSIGDMLYL